MNRTSSARRWLVTGLASAALAMAVGLTAYVADMNRITERLAAGSDLIMTRHGQIEFVSWGNGPAVLVVHGAGGGYDQGRLLPIRFGGDGYRWISVSRFGYLRSALPEDGSTLAQAEALADLLDALGVNKVAVLAMSGGVPPALQFARLFPDRTSALVLLSSAPYTPMTAADQGLAIPAWVYQALFSSDFIFWTVVRLFPSQLDTFFDVSADARSHMSKQDQAFVSGLVDTFLPVTARVAGLRNEGAAIDPRSGYDLAAIAAPTLVVHARDDGINPFAIGVHTAQSIAGAELMALPDGGHLLLGHADEARDRVMEFLKAHAPPAPSGSPVSQ
jgi:2-hydroxy-6-oxonona-2,4-dienedioate hydrolase